MPPIGQIRNNPGAQISPFNPQQGDTAAAAFQRLASYYPNNRSVSSTPAPVAAAKPAMPQAPDYSKQLAAMQNSYVAPIPFNPAAGGANHMAQINVSTPTAGRWAPASQAYWDQIGGPTTAGLNNYQGGQLFNDLLRKGHSQAFTQAQRTIVPAIASMDEAYRKAALGESLGLQEYAANQQNRNSQLMAQLAAMIMGS